LPIYLSHYSHTNGPGLIYGEPPLYIPGDYKLVGIDILSKEKLKEYVKKVKKERWRVDESYEAYKDNSR